MMSAIFNVDQRIANTLPHDVNGGFFKRLIP